jgi:hypothetical protein
LATNTQLVVGLAGGAPRRSTSTPVVRRISLAHSLAHWCAKCPRRSISVDTSDTTPHVIV